MESTQQALHEPKKRLRGGKKLGIVLIAAGGALILDGTTRILWGVLWSEPWFVGGGIVTGWFLGAYLFFRGKARIDELGT